MLKSTGRPGRLLMPTSHHSESPSEHVRRGKLGWFVSEERDVQVQRWQHKRASAGKHFDRRSTASLLPTILTIFRSRCYSDVDAHSCTLLRPHVAGAEETLLLMSRSSGGVTTCVYESFCYGL